MGMASAATSNAATCTTVVRMINGVWNPEHQTINTATLRLLDVLKTDPSICVKLPLFNPGRGFIYDLVETNEMLRATDITWWQNFRNTVASEALKAPKYAVSALTGLNYQQEQNRLVMDMWATVKGDIDGGRNVILIPHSQGNLFANGIRQLADYTFDPKYTSAKKLMIIHLASPTLVIVEDKRSNYFLASVDLVVGLLFAQNKSNMTAFSDFDTIVLDDGRVIKLRRNVPFLGHGLLEVYMSSSIMARIVQTGTDSQNCIAAVQTPLTALVNSIKATAACQADASCSLNIYATCDNW